MSNQKDAEDNDPVIQENRILSVQVNISKALINLYRVAYDALLHHGVNWHKLKEYAQLAYAPKIEANTLEQSQSKIITMIEGCMSAIHAAVRRKGFRVLGNGGKPKDNGDNDEH